MRLRALVAVVMTTTVTVATGVIVVPTGAAAAANPYRSPVDVPIVDGFRPPPEPWQSGNRGIDYGTSAGDAVHAAADGEVVFAGDVAGTLHVTVRHADGLRTSYSFLATIDVVRGQRVRRGDCVGTAGGTFHFGVRTPDDEYLDPVAVLEGRIAPPVRLVRGAEDGEHPLWEERRSLLRVVLDAGVEAVAAAGGTSAELARLAVHYAIELDPATHAARMAFAAYDWWQQSRQCTDPSVATPSLSSTHIVVEVSGLGTASASNSAWELDTQTIGYADGDVVRFSYAGGRAPDEHLAREAFPSVAVREFSSIDSQQSIELSASRLETLLASIARDRPGVPIDVVAHSQGGVVARLALERSGDRLPDEVSTFVTIGSPHQGAPLATAVTALGHSAAGEAALAQLRGSSATGPLDDRLPAIAQLAETSGVIVELHDGSIPARVRFVTIGAAGDLTVPGSAALDAAADARVMVDTPIGPAVHGDQVRDPRVTREVALAVAGRGPTCTSFGSAMGARARAEAVRATESFAAATAAGFALAATGPN